MPWKLSKKIHIAISVGRNIPKVIRLVWESSWAYTLVLGVITILQGLLPISRVWVGKFIVDSVIRAANSGGQIEDVKKALVWVGVEFALTLAGHLVRHLGQFVQKVLGDLLTNQITAKVMQKAIDLDVAFYENSIFYDKLQKAQRESGYRPMTILNQILSIVQNLVSVSGMLALLFSFHPLIALLVILTTAPVVFTEVKYSRQQYMLIDHRVPEGRKQAYLHTVLTSNWHVKEIRLFQLGKHLLSRSLDIMKRFLEQNKSLAIRRNMASFLLNILSSLGFYGSYVYIVYEAILQHVTIGSMTMYVQAISRVQGNIQTILTTISRTYENSLFISDLFSFLALQPEIVPDPKLRPVPVNIKKGIEFRDVSFKYPGSDGFVLRDINLEIRAGENIALVGPNGSGKTTLVKLLTRLYDPTEGAILIEDTDIREFNVESLQERFGVIFQDYAKYNLTARENIGFGKIEELENVEKIMLSARKSEAHQFIEELSRGYETTLGRLFENGHELSIGQWQKIALARAFMRDAPILILDEPTAALDAETEYKVFKKFSELSDRKISILISHRFSTVRMADRIFILNNGRMIERGTHDELMELKGEYARFFNMQAEAYRQSVWSARVNEKAIFNAS